MNIIKTLFLSLLLLCSLPSVFYAESEPGGGDVPDIHRDSETNYPLTERNPNPLFDREFWAGREIYCNGHSKKILLLTFHAAYGGPRYNLEMGVRLTYFFNTPHERIKFIGVFSPYIMRSKVVSFTPFTTRHYLSFSALAGIYLFGFYGVGGIDMNFKISGRDADYWVDDAIYYRKTCWHGMFEIGYLYMPADHQKISFAFMLFYKMRKNGGYYDGGYKYIDNNYRGGSAGFSISIGFNAL